MGHAASPLDYKDLLVFLATAGVVVPLFHRFRVSPVLGFLIAGVALGPDGLGRFAEQVPWARYVTLDDIEGVQGMAEFGVVFLLFMIGLELSWERLQAMRRFVFGLGMAQVALCTALLSAAALALGQPLAAALTIGAGLALSSTAVVMPVLAERKKLNSRVGRSAFSILLAQDLAVAPILIAITVAASAQAGGPWTDGLVSLAGGVGALIALVVGGRLLLRPMFHSVAKADSQELFVAASLLVVAGASVIAALGGLSMALGAFVAGLLLAETEFRHEVEVTIEPFKGLLLGVFFLSVGAGLDLDGLIASPLPFLGIAAGVAIIKAVVVFGLARGFGLAPRPALETAMVIAPAGEFAFVIVAAAVNAKLLAEPIGQAALVSATISLFATPMLAVLAEKLGRFLKTPDDDLPDAGVEDPAGERVLIIGHGRVGRLVGEMLSLHDIDYVAIDSDPDTVRQARGEDRTIYFGDAARPEFLKVCGIETTRAVVVTMDAPAKVIDVVRTARALRPDLTIVARARDDRHAAELYRLGATDAVPETTEASLQLAENTLVDLGVPMGLVLASVHEKREQFRKLFQASAGDDRPMRAVRRTTKR
jgi:CPA2 family monovalent cation:H+ antiporter-2